MYTIRVIRVLSLLIMAAAAAVSYQTQRHLFETWSVDAFTSAIAPVGIDLLAIICTLAIHAEDVARRGRRAAVVVLAITGSGSLTANFLAGSTVGSRVVHAAMVMLYLLAEWIAAQVRPTTATPPRNAPTSPGLPPIEVEAPEVLAYRQAAKELAKTSKLAALNSNGN